MVSISDGSNSGHDSSTSLSIEHSPTESTSPHNVDLEKAISSRSNGSAGLTRRVTRVESIRSGLAARQTFTHSLGHVKTTEDVVVHFDGSDDPYHPQNWPFRKKVVTTMFYGLTTMGATWSSSV
jgi:MFS transporter, DHA1 family, multidrug resistance protein